MKRSNLTTSLDKHPSRYDNTQAGAPKKEGPTQAHAPSKQAHHEAGASPPRSAQAHAPPPTRLSFDKIVHSVNLLCTQ